MTVTFYVRLGFHVNNLHSEMVYAMGLSERASVTQRLPRGSLDQRDLEARFGPQWVPSGHRLQ
jgi:hypothetical protein